MRKQSGMRAQQNNQGGARGRVLMRAALAVALALCVGALYLGIARAEALLLDLGRFVGCL